MDAVANIRAVADIMALWPTDADFARDIGIKPSHAQVMQTRDSIPAPYWSKVVAAAAERGIEGVTLELLAQFAEAKSFQSITPAPLPEPERAA